MVLFEKLVVGEGAAPSPAPPLTARDLYIKTSQDLEFRMHSYTHCNQSLAHSVESSSLCVLSFN